MMDEFHLLLEAAADSPTIRWKLEAFPVNGVVFPLD